MTDENYKPTKKEVFNEFGKQIKSGTNKTLNYIKENGKSFIETQGVFYTLPSLLRKRDDLPERNLGQGLGIFLGSMQLFFYIINANNTFLPDKELWLIPVATNVISGLYEAGRAIYKNTEKRIIEKHNKSLEGELKE